MSEQKVKVPGSFYFWGSLVVLALVALSVIPSTMVYRLRLFEAVGLPEWMAEVLRFIIVIATPFAVLSTGAVRVFAVSDSSHAAALKTAAVLEIVAFVSEILAALVNGHELFALIGQAVFLCLAIACVAWALVISLSESGFYKMVIAHNEQSLLFQKEYVDLFKSTMKTPEMRAAMVSAITEQIKSAAVDQAGRELFEKDRIGIVPLNGHKTFAATVGTPPLSK